MALSQNPQIVTNGLILYCDMYNTKKSFKGKPVTNQFAIPTPDGNGDVTFAVNGTGIFRRIFSGTYGGYDIKPSDIVYRYNLSSTGGCHYHGNSASIGSGQYATFTFDYYVSQDAANYPSTNFLANFENYGGNALSAGLAAPNSYKGVWQTVTLTAGPTSGTGTQAMFLYPGSCGGDLATSGFVLFKNPQCIFSSTPNDTASFVAGTRSNNESILDLIGGKTISVSGSPTFNTNSVTFSNTNSAWIEPTTPGDFKMSTSNFTLSTWIKQLDNGTNVILEARGTSLVGYLWTLNYPSSGQISVFLNYGGDQYIYSSSIASLGYGSVQNIVAVVNRSNNEINLYLNGLLWNTITGVHSQNISPSSGELYRIGYDLGGSTQNYELYSYMHYNRALSSSEVLQNFNAQRGLYGL